MARYLITGIAGFIGSSLAHELVALGHDVRGIDNLTGGTLENLANIRRKIEFHQIDLNDRRGLNECCKGVDYVLHQAAIASVPRSVKDPLASHDANVSGTLNLLLAARDAGVSRVVYAASSSAYGDQPTQPKREDMTPQPLSPYAAQKLAGEHYVQSFWHVYGLEGVCLRYFNIFGPKQAANSPYSGVIARFISDMMEGITPTIFGTGAQSRDFTFVQNAVAANLLACQAPAKAAAGQVFNIGTGESHTLNKTYAHLADLLGFDAPPRYATPRAGDIEHSEADTSKAARALNYHPKTSFRDGLSRTVDWYLEQRQRKPASAAKEPATATSL